MTKTVQLAGGNATSQNQFTGAPRELTVDTSNQELRLHDGVTVGGHRIYNRDQNDQRYQARSLELDGFKGWELSESGWLVRLGLAKYRIMTLSVNAAYLTVANPDGYDGNPLFSIAATISSDHSFTGEVNFTQNVAFTGGITGDVTGNVTGNLTGDVT